MFQISTTQMNQLSAFQRRRDLREVCEHFARDDPALAMGRSVESLLPMAERAESTANALGLVTIGAVVAVMMLLLALEGSPDAKGALQPLFDALLDKSQSEKDRLEAVHLLLFDLDESMPRELRRDRPTISATPELDV